MCANSCFIFPKWFLISNVWRNTIHKLLSKLCFWYMQACICVLYFFLFVLKMLFKNIFIQTRLKFAKNQANAKHHPEAKPLLVENYSLLHPLYYPKIIRHILKNKQKKKCVCIHDIIWLIIIKTKMEMKNRLHRYDIKRPSSRHAHKYRKYKKCLSMMMPLCIKKYLSNIWSSIHEKVKQHWSWAEK